MRKILLLGMALILAMVLPASAADYPIKPIQLVVPWSPGGGSDMSGRITADALKDILPQPVIVSNMVGSAGLNAARYVLNAPADGYTLLWEHATNLAMAPEVTHASFRWTDFNLICSVGYSDVALFCNAKAPWKNAKEAFADIKKNPNKYRWGASLNTSGHLALMNMQASIGDLPVMLLNIQGGDKAKLVSIIGDNTDFATAAVAAIDPYVKSGDVRILGMLSKDRSPFYPDVPTLREQGCDCLSEFYYALLAPKGTPAAVVEKLRTAFKKAAENPETRNKLKAQFITAKFVDTADINQLWKDVAASVQRLVQKQKAAKK